MSANPDNTVVLSSCKALSDFIEAHLHDTDLGWPCMPRSQCFRHENRGHLGPSGLRILVVGELALEVPVAVTGTTKALTAELAGRGHSLAWTLHEPRVGGFAAYAAQSSAALGARVTLRTTLPIPIPNRFAEFLHEYDPNMPQVSAIPGACNVILVFQCTDGVVLRLRRGSIPQAAWTLPRSHLLDFDAVVLDTATCHSTGAGNDGTDTFSHASPRDLSIAVRACHEWTESDAALAQDAHSWTFLAGEDARQILHDTAMTGGALNDLALARRVQLKYRIPRIAFTVGSNVALLRHGDADVHWVRSCPITSARYLGVAETLLSVTALSSATGADDLTSLERGVAAASGYAAGLDLPCHLEELDVG